MKITPCFYIFLLPFLLFLSCSDSHFLKEEKYRQQVQADFGLKELQLPFGDLFSIFRDSTLTVAEREALMFLYAYMPVGDITDYPGSYYLENIHLSQLARQEMPWGGNIPDDIFRHFVLPVRVNNENLDNSRRVFYDELKDRISHLSMKDAILEVNHWCHEKVVYRPSDARTSSPLSSVKAAYGRCGEESTFTVAALRAVGIPARQVYTPRWAHTDDNHAWVEAWADGKWYFFGACEPEPVLNLGWFNEPASRGMLMHTKVFGRYSGPEEVMYETPDYTEINVIENYANAAKAVVTVLDKSGNHIRGAKVEFKVYNYAEFYSVATKYTDEFGQVSLTAGKGDMLVWASKGNSFGFGKLSFGKEKEMTLVMDKTPGMVYSLDLDIVPPAEGTGLPEVSSSQRAENDRRIAVEDSIRNAYVSTFITKDQAEAFAKELAILDTALVARLLTAARGNYQTLTDFLRSAAQEDKTDLALRLLSVISEKDLRDITPEVLDDHFHYSDVGFSGEFYNSYVLNPRVANEMLTPYKKFFQEVVPAVEAEKYRMDPQLLVAWCKKNIGIVNDLNSQRIPISPAGVWKASVADEKSRDIFFVALARALSIPAWIDDVTGKVQCRVFANSRLKNGQTIDVDFEASEQTLTPTGLLRATYRPIRSLDDPKYYSHFTLSRFENGTFHLLNYNEETTTWASLLENGTHLDTGYYMLTTGTRLANGSVLVNLSFFNVEEEEPTIINLCVRESKEEVQVIGSFNSESAYRTVDSGQMQTLLQACGRGYFVVGVLGAGQEPTNHALKDIAAFNSDFEKWGRKMVLLFQNDSQVEKYHPEDFPGLPSTILYGIDIDNGIQKQIVESMKLSSSVTLPIFIIADTFNRVVFVSQGYTIGLGEQLMKVVHGI